MDKALEYAIPAGIAACGIVAGWLGSTIHHKRKEKKRRARANVSDINRGATAS